MTLRLGRREWHGNVQGQEGRCCYRSDETEERTLHGSLLRVKGLLDADLAAHRPVSFAEVRIDTGLSQLDGGDGAFSLELLVELAVGTVGSTRGHGVGDVVLIDEADL